MDKNHLNNYSKKQPDNKTDKQLENMRNAVIDEQKCKEIALKLTEYIKTK